MNTTGRLSFVWMLILALVALAAPLRAAAASEDKLIADLDSSIPTTVTAALQKLEKEYPTSTKAFPKIKQLLSDKREKVRRKAARVLGVLHAEVSTDDLKAITAMLKATDPQEVIDGLKSLRGLKAAGVLPEVLPLLKHSTPNVVRDACRTVAVFGTKENIPALEPLLNHPVAAVKSDAQDAIFQLKAKP